MSPLGVRVRLQGCLNFGVLLAHYIGAFVIRRVLLLLFLYCFFFVWGGVLYSRVMVRNPKGIVLL